jgi:3-methyladenine DNA glycosylase/8-oxoguanine DNA glycosylase
MRKITFYSSLGICFLFTSICSAQLSFKTIKKDFAKLSGTWEGSLTYVDYSTGKPYTMPANLEIIPM